MKIFFYGYITQWDINGRMCKSQKKSSLYILFWIMHPTTVPSWVHYPKEINVHFGNYSGTVCHVKILDWSHKPLEETRKGVSWLINEACAAFETPLKF